MPRTNDAAVQGVIETDASISLTPYIEVASALVTRICVGSSYDSTLLELIERWLAAHFYALRDKRVSSEGVKGLTTSYEAPKTAMYLSNTVYGQTALSVDIYGSLAAWQKQLEDGVQSVSAGVYHLGSDPDTDGWAQ
jgi:hypothetical protein